MGPGMSAPPEKPAPPFWQKLVAFGVMIGVLWLGWFGLTKLGGEDMTERGRITLAGVKESRDCELLRPLVRLSKSEAKALGLNGTDRKAISDEAAYRFYSAGCA